MFLDIEMPAERGTELAATLPEPRPFIVFATAYEQYAVDAFQYRGRRLPAQAGEPPAPAGDARPDARQAADRRRAAERELAAASRAQAHLLPQSLPEPPGYMLAAHTLAASGVGGDFYDAVLAGDHLAFVLGDVAGKGMAAGSSLRASRLDGRRRCSCAT